MCATSFEGTGQGTVICGGTARLPHSSTTGNAMLIVEVEVEPQSRSVVAVYVNPDLQGLKHLLESVVVGRSVTDIPTTGVRAIKERYLSPFRNAAGAALVHAWEAFAQIEKKAPTALESRS